MNFKPPYKYFDILDVLKKDWSLEVNYSSIFLDLEKAKNNNNNNIEISKNDNNSKYENYSKNDNNSKSEIRINNNQFYKHRKKNRRGDYGKNVKFGFSYY